MHNKHLCKNLTRETESGVSFLSMFKVRRKINMIQREQKQENGRKETGPKRQDIKKRQESSNYLAIS